VFRRKSCDEFFRQPGVSRRTIHYRNHEKAPPSFDSHRRHRSVAAYCTGQDKDRDKWEDQEKRHWKELRDDVRELEQSQGRLLDSAKLGNISRQTWDTVNYLGTDVRRVTSQFEHGQYNFDELRNRVARLQSGINRTRDQVRYEQAARRGRYYR
jgi:hypothetical protein